MPAASGLPQDLVKFGLIPELVGRVPVTVSLDLLDKEALIRILTEPKSSLVKQYQKLMELDGVKLEFDKAALDAIAETSGKGKRSQRIKSHYGRYYDGYNVPWYHLMMYHQRMYDYKRCCGSGGPAIV